MTTKLKPAKLDRRKWHSYATYGYTFDAANDQASAGGVHIHEVRQMDGEWFHRILQSNGRNQAYGPVTPISEADGWARFLTACNMRTE